MFKNATVYRIGPAWATPMEEVEERLGKARFVPCGATQPESVGWVEPRGTAHGPLVEVIGGQWVLKLMVESKVLPGTVVKRKTDALVKKIEQETGRKPGKKQTKEIKEAAVLELLPMAFTKQSAVIVWIDPKHRLLLVDAGSQGKADAVVTHLVKALDGFAVTLVQTETAAATAMAAWLTSHEAPAGFTVDRECELKSSDEMKSVVRYSRHTLDTDEVRDHILGGKVPTRLAMTWEGRVSFMLTDTMQIKKITFLDVVFEASSKQSNKEDGFDADTAIATGEMSKLIPDLLDALGGELAGIGAASEASAVTPSAPTGSVKGTAASAAQVAPALATGEATIDEAPF
ncbi:recombination-associated protein RdgC [soil metagenome]